MLSLQLHLPIAASFIFQQSLTKQQLPSVQDSKGCARKERAFYTPCIICRFALLFHLTGRSTEDQTGSIRFRFWVFLLFLMSWDTNMFQAVRFRFQTLLFQVSLLIIMIKRHCNWKKILICVYFQTLFPVDIFKHKVLLKWKCMEVDWCCNWFKADLSQNCHRKTRGDNTAFMMSTAYGLLIRKLEGREKKRKYLWPC